MNYLVRARLKLRDGYRGQTMTEYALILSAIAVIAFAGYQAVGGDISRVLALVAYLLTPLSVPPGQSG